MLLLIKARSFVDGLLPSSIVSEKIIPALNLVDNHKKDWTVVSADSEQGGNLGANAIDGNTGTVWHTAWDSSATSHPHTLVVDLKKNYSIAGFIAIPRSDGSNGVIKDYDLYLSEDGKSWGTPVSSGTLSSSLIDTKVRFKKTFKGRYAKLVAKSSYSGIWTSLAELDFLTVK